jgi:hypothetical protein|tara:strand:+ start:5746 stop:6534 length:789 start_codon:yes stop_codon:yes gene_type:complete
MGTETTAFTPSTLETIDTAFYRWVDEQLDLHVRANKETRKVPVIWAGAERAYQIKKRKERRDQSETLILPLITIERTSVQKDPSRMGPFGNNVYNNKDRRRNNFLVGRKIQARKTQLFANAESERVQDTDNSRQKSKRVVYEFSFIPTPTWVHVTYSVKLITEYQTHMNDLVTPFMSRFGNAYSFDLGDENNAYEGFIAQDFQQNNNLSSLGEEERRFETDIEIRVEGFLIGEGTNQEQQTVAVRENQVKIRFKKEETFFTE